MRDDARRLELLAAIGIDVYRLRERGAGEHEPEGITVDARLVVACLRSVRRDARSAHRLAQVVRALGVASGAVRWIEADARAAAMDLPDVPAYLMIGADAARTCSAQLSLEQQAAAAIAVMPETGMLPGDAAARRALWQVLKPLARRLAGA